MSSSRALFRPSRRALAAACLAALLGFAPAPAAAQQAPLQPQENLAPLPGQPSAALTLVLDSPEGPGLPRHFRTAGDSISPDLADRPSLLGLGQLRVSGSGQFSRAQLTELKAHLPASFIVVDLRQESHGFLSGQAVSWYGPRDTSNLGQSLDWIERDEEARLQQSMQAGRVVVAEIIAKDEQGAIAQTERLILEVTSAQSEAQLLALMGQGYLRLPVTDHLRPTDQAVENFLRFWRSLPAGAWLHFHCRAGVGRTTTFMLMADILANAHQVELEDLASRQHLLGGAELLHSPPDNWKRAAYMERAAFLRAFYDFVRHGQPGQPGSWLAWLAVPPQVGHPPGP